MNNQEIQKSELAGKTKLTAVSIGHGTNKVVAFVQLAHDSHGHAKLPPEQLDQMLNSVGCRKRGQTFTHG